VKRLKKVTVTFKEIYMKKKRLRVLGLAALTLVFALVLAGCGADPEGLAKQTYSLYQESVAAMDNPMKLPGVMLKAASLGKKVNNLSESDRQIYNEEMVRLGGAEMGGLFDIEGLSSLFSGEDGSGTWLDSLLGDGVSAQSGGSARKSISVEDSAAATTGGASGGSAVAPTTVGESGKTAAFFSMFDSGTYHMKAKTVVGGMEVISETFIKGDMMATVGEMGGMSYRSVKRDNTMYVINDEARTVMVMTIPANTGSTPEETVRTPGMVVTSSGTAQFNGKNLPYEEYSTVGNDVRVQLFLDGNNLAGMRTISRSGTVDMIILALDQNVPNSVFEIPAGYQKIEMPGGY
jgi:hypothetical protein